MSSPQDVPQLETETNLTQERPRSPSLDDRMAAAVAHSVACTMNDPLPPLTTLVDLFPTLAQGDGGTAATVAHPATATDPVAVQWTNSMAGLSTGLPTITGEHSNITTAESCSRGGANPSSRQGLIKGSQPHRQNPVRALQGDPSTRGGGSRAVESPLPRVQEHRHAGNRGYPDRESWQRDGQVSAQPRQELKQTYRQTPQARRTRESIGLIKRPNNGG